MNANALYRKRKKELLYQLDKIDKNAELMGLCAHDRELHKN